MKRIEFLFLLFVMLPLSDSCTSALRPGTGCTRAVLELAAPEYSGTKAPDVAPYDRISDIVLVAADRRDEGTLAMSVYIDSGDMGNITIFFPDESSVYDVYVLANCGDLRDDLARGFRESGLPFGEFMRSYMLRFGDYSDFESRGVPMSGSLEGCRPGNRVRIRMTRLVAIVDVRFNLPSSVRLKLKDFSLMQCTGSSSPFSSGFRASYPGDMLPGAAVTLDDASLEKLSGGAAVRMCLLENSHGRLLDANRDPRMKVPSNTSVPEYVSYYEFHADVMTDQDVEYRDAVFRFCLGKDTASDFSVDRNTLYTYTITLRESLDGVDWIVDPGEPLYPEVEPVGHYRCSFYWDESAGGGVRCCSESLYFDVKYGRRTSSHVPFRYYHYDAYGNEYVFGPYTTMNAYIEDWNWNYGQYDRLNPSVKNDRIVIYFDSKEYVYDYMRMNIVHE